MYKLLKCNNFFITLGFSESRLGKTLQHRLVCWFHAEKAIDKRLSDIKDLAKRAMVKTRVVLMQLCHVCSCHNGKMTLMSTHEPGILNIFVYTG